MSAHTPGPWVTYRGKVYHHEGITQWKSTVIRPVVNGRVMSISLARCDNPANAQLISATPDLLAALLDCIAVMEAELKGLAAIQPELRAARAAIEKATGVTP